MSRIGKQGKALCEETCKEFNNEIDSCQSEDQLQALLVVAGWGFSVSVSHEPETSWMLQSLVKRVLSPLGFLSLPVKPAIDGGQDHQGKNVLLRMPPMTTVARGRCTSAPMLVASAMGTNPNEATSAVISTGRSRLETALDYGFLYGQTLRPELTDKAHQHQAVETATPESAINPTPAEIVNGISAEPQGKNPTSEGQRHSGEHQRRQPHRVKPGKEQHENKNNASGTTTINRSRAAIRFSNCPPQVIQ